MAEIFVLRHGAPLLVYVMNFSPRPLRVQLCPSQRVANPVQRGLLLPETWRPILRLNRMRAKKTFVVVILLLVGAVALSILSRPVQSRAMRQALTGYVLEVNPDLNRITVRNADMPGVMASMVMDYRVRDAGALNGIKPGDSIQATMVMDGGYWLEDIKVVGSRP